MKSPKVTRLRHSYQTHCQLFLPWNRPAVPSSCMELRGFALYPLTSTAKRPSPSRKKKGLNSLGHLAIPEFQSLLFTQDFANFLP